MPSEIVISSLTADADLPTSRTWLPRGLVVLLVVFCIVATTIFLWPAYRATLNVSIEPNEGWNAVFADAALGKMPLYPPKESLLTNNYPPLSYYFVGAVGRVLGDNVIAGRWISLLSLLAIGFSCAGIVREMTGNWLAGGVAWASCVGFMSRFFDRYVGMDDPQIFAHAVMSGAFFWFVRGQQRSERSCAGPVLLFVVAGFIKHNVVAMPFTAMLWLVWHRRGLAIRAFVLAGLAIGVGFGLCLLFFGHDFFLNFLTPRGFSWKQGWAGMKTIEPLAIPMAIALGLGWIRRSNPWMQCCNLLVGIGFIVFFLQKCGNGVDRNAAFDLVIALSITLGMGFALFPSFRGTADWGRLAMLAALCIFLHHDAKFKIFRAWFDPDFRRNIALHEEVMVEAVATVRAMPGDVICDFMLCYRAGKPAVVDGYNVAERVAAGALPADCLDSRIRDGRLTVYNPYGYRLAHRLPSEKGARP